MSKDKSNNILVIYQGRLFRIIWNKTGALHDIRSDGKAINTTNAAHKAIELHSEALRTGSLPEGFSTPDKKTLRVKSGADRVKASRQRAIEAGGALAAPFVMPADVVQGVEMLIASGYAPSRNACFLRAIREASEPLRKMQKST